MIGEIGRHNFHIHLRLNEVHYTSQNVDGSHYDFTKIHYLRTSLRLDRFLTNSGISAISGLIAKISPSGLIK